jgi:16S rRNA processing protein RimM
MLPYGVVGRPHGLRGDVLVHLFNPAAAPLDGARLPLSVSLVRPGGEAITMQLAQVRGAADSLLFHFAGVEDRDAAAALTNAELWVPRASLPPLGPGEFFVQDLVGCAVVDTAGRARGVVQGTVWNGAHDILTITGAEGDELLVPAVPEFLREVDLGARRVVVDPHDEGADDDAR